MLSNNEMRKYINRISFRSLLKTSLSHQVPSYHDLHLAHHYSTIVIDIMNHLQTNEQQKKMKSNKIRQAHDTELTLLCSNTIWLKIHGGVGQQCKGNQEYLGRGAHDTILQIFPDAQLRDLYEKKVLVSILDVKPPKCFFYW